MAEFTSSPMAGGYQHSDSYDPQPALRSGSNQLVTLTNVAGAVVSFALVIGIGIWGYKLVVRDVTGIPVVRAASGEMRVRPEDPGGRAAQHQGLSVNAVAAVGTAAAPADRLILAPRPIDLEAEDAVMPTDVVAIAPQAAPEPSVVDPLAQVAVVDAGEVAAALETGNVDDLVAQLTAGVAPLAPLQDRAQEVVASVNDAVVAEVTAAERQVAAILDAPGVRQSPRPRIRPAVRAAIVPASLTQDQTPAPLADVDPTSVPAGTRLAQLGAFDSAEVARAQWDQLSVRFDAYLSDKQRIVQKATSGGRVFYRLRAMGFEDIADARRFCSALVAENADCIPVVTR